ncbi:MAG: hypothetical protein IJ575_07050 [Selenomonadaceae bacterium]|nr:hypothetical protein [Selenomonadaceae bacterium]
MKLFPDSKIYIYAPWNYHTGGPELLHQLGSCLRRLNFDAVMCYCDPNSKIDPVHAQLKKYHLPYVSESEIVDDEKNIVILPETIYKPLDKFRNLQIVFWWLSVDNYLNIVSAIVKSVIDKREWNRLPLTMLSVMHLPNVEHWIQSEYARQFLEFNHVPKDRIHFVGDYLVPTFLEKSKSINLDSKLDQIVYNPKKGFELTKKLIDSAKDLKFIPIQNMNSDQVQDLLAKSKIYIDFGNHPGKDRIPREAAVSHCVVITGKRGSAGNEIDIPIPPDFKFDDSIGNDEKIIPKIIERLRTILKNFKAEHDRQNSYRDSIYAEPMKFIHDVAQAVKTAPPPRKNIALHGNLKEIAILFDKLINQSEFEILYVVSDEIKSKGIYFGDKMFPIISTADAKFLCQESRIDFIAGLHDESLKQFDSRYRFVI